MCGQRYVRRCGRLVGFCDTRVTNRSVLAGDYVPLLIMPAPTVMPVASSMRMKDPVVRFFE